MGSRGDPCGDGNVLYLDCIHVNNLIVIIYDNFARCYYSEKLNTRYTGFLCVISYNCV